MFNQILITFRNSSLYFPTQLSLSILQLIEQINQLTSPGRENDDDHVITQDHRLHLPNLSENAFNYIISWSQPTIKIWHARSFTLWSLCEVHTVYSTSRKGVPGRRRRLTVKPMMRTPLDCLICDVCGPNPIQFKQQKPNEFQNHRRSFNCYMESVHVQCQDHLSIQQLNRLPPSLNSYYQLEWKSI